MLRHIVSAVALLALVATGPAFTTVADGSAPAVTGNEDWLDGKPITTVINQEEGTAEFYGERNDNTQPDAQTPAAQQPQNTAGTATQAEEVELRFNCPRVQRECWPLYYEIDPGDPSNAVAVTASDFVSFRPAAPVAHMQPNGFAVVGRHSNFYADASSHTRTGTLLELPASALFTPVGYRWDYGDGSSRTVTSKGGTWESLGLAEFDPTPASHVYTARGSYTSS